jgi:hypothetical protein
MEQLLWGDSEEKRITVVGEKKRGRIKGWKCIQLLFNL